MFKNKIKLFRLLGFTVSVDTSWVVILFLVVWSLAKGVFPSYYPDLSGPSYWLMGLLGAVGFFVCIVIHEFSHSLVARRYGLEIRGITLFIFGGVAEMKEEPSSPKAEFFMAVAGPIASLLLSIFFGALYQIAGSLEWPVPAMGVLGYLSAINLLLALFNMVPAFPTDGGRVLRSALWWIKGDIHWATKLASRISLLFAMAIVFTGFISLVGGNFIGGLWWILIGSFLFNAANASYQHLLMERSFRGKTVRSFMNPNPVTVPSHTTLQEFVENYLYHYHYKMFPVVDGTGVSGIITIREVKAVPREEWPHLSVGRLAQPQSQDNSIAPGAPVKEALRQMSESGLSRLLVIEQGELVGIVTLKDLLEFLALKMEFEQ
jgi:Zn-dependent protease